MLKYFDPDFGISQLFNIRFSNGLQYYDGDFISFDVKCDSEFLNYMFLITVATMNITGERENIPSWVADWPHCCDFEGDTCDGLRCFQNPQNRSKMVFFITPRGGQALS